MTTLPPSLFLLIVFFFCTNSTPGNLAQLSVGRPPATPKLFADDSSSSSVNLGSGRIMHKRYSGGGNGGGGGGSGELHPAAPADTGHANAAAAMASTAGVNTLSVAGTTASTTLDSSDSVNAGAGPVLWSAVSLARGAAGGSGGVGSSSSRAFTPVSGGGPSFGSRRVVTPQDGGRQA